MSLLPRVRVISAYCTLTAGSSVSPLAGLRGGHISAAAIRCRSRILRASAVTFHATRARSTRLASVGARRRTLRQRPWLNTMWSRSASSEQHRTIASAMAGAEGNSSMAGMGRRYVASVLGLGLAGGRVVVGLE